MKHRETRQEREMRFAMDIYISMLTSGIVHPSKTAQILLMLSGMQKPFAKEQDTKLKMPEPINLLQMQLAEDGAERGVIFN